jgi:hypothetical protein
MDDEAAVQAFVDSGCDTIIGDLTLVNSDREQLPVVPVRILEGALLVLGCPRLRSLDGLESLEAATSIALSKTDTYDQWGQWTPVGLNDLTDLTALSNVVSVGYSGVDFSDALGGLSIQYAPRLRKLDGLENVTTLGGLSLQSLPALQNLEALDNLERLFFYTIGDCACIGWNDIERLLSGFVLGAPSLASWTPSDDPCVDSDADGSATEP